MKYLNYNHLHYFWMVFREGSIVRAAQELMVSQPTISIQLKALEKALGHRLFERSGRGLALTEAGKITFSHADEIFSLGSDLVAVLDEQPARRPLKLTVGIVDVIPKSIVRHLLAPALRLQPTIRLICREDKADRLLADLAAQRVDLVLSDAPIGTGVHLRGFNHLLVECGISFLVTRRLSQKYRRHFPRSLHGAPMLLPSDHTTVRQSLNAWFDSKRIRPQVLGEFDDTALMLSVAEDGLGIVPFPSEVAHHAQREFSLTAIGKAPEVRERFYAISPTEKPSHPAVAAICASSSMR